MSSSAFGVLLLLALARGAAGFGFAATAPAVGGCRRAHEPLMGLRRKNEAQQQQEQGLLGRSMGGAMDGGGGLFPDEMGVPDTTAYRRARPSPPGGEKKGGGKEGGEQPESKSDETKS